MSADPDAGPVGGGGGVGPRVAVLHQGRGELVHHVRVGAAVAAALSDGEMFKIMGSRLQDLKITQIMQPGTSTFDRS